MGGFVAEADVSPGPAGPVCLPPAGPQAAYKIIIQRLNIIVWPMAQASSWLVLHITHQVH